jgi:hypothetical protein
MIELQEVGERKGNYRSRLIDALDALKRYKDRSGTIRTGGTKNGSGFSGVGAEPPEWRNPHSIGMT